MQNKMSSLNFSLRFGQVDLDAHVLLRISACAVVTGYGPSLTEEIEAHRLLMCPEVSLLIADC